VYHNVYAGKRAETEPTPSAAVVAHVGDSDDSERVLATR
jgi:hypothetical protein